MLDADYCTQQSITISYLWGQCCGGSSEWMAVMEWAGGNRAHIRMPGGPDGGADADGALPDCATRRRLWSVAVAMGGGRRVQCAGRRGRSSRLR